MPRAEEIKSEIQLLVEGNDQRNFFEAFISHIYRSQISRFRTFGGVSELSGFLACVS